MNVGQPEFSVKEVDVDNFCDVCELTTNPDGIATAEEKYISGNAVSIAESKFYPEMYPMAIYRGDTLVGFVTFEQKKATLRQAQIYRYMIDHRYQGKGWGRRGFQAVLDYLRGVDVTDVMLMIDPENTIAKNLYLSFGFSFTGKIEDGEHYYRLEL